MNMDVLFCLRLLAKCLAGLFAVVSVLAKRELGVPSEDANKTAAILKDVTFEMEALHNVLTRYP